MHLGTAARHIAGEVAGQSAQGLVPEPRRGHCRQRFHCDFPSATPQPAIIALLASGYAPVYPCHVSPRDMRQHPIGTGPFKFVEFKPNEHVKVARNPDYWNSGRPYLDGIEYTVITNRSTAILSFNRRQV